jgi:BirA family biotin operon repressor/biotin-[acetyl-CoA-carboxylase] ligase
MKIFRYEIIDSTNTRAREYAKSEAPDLPAVFIADGQTAGRGRRGRSFDSERGAGLYISFLFKPRGAARDAVKITLRAAVALCRALRSVCGLETEIKWVNDIFVGGKKLAGILTEGEIDSLGNFEYAVCGIGVNLNCRKFPPELSGIVTTVEDNTGKKPDRERLIEALISEFFRDVNDSEIIEEYRRLSAVIGKRVEVHKLTGEIFCAKALEITDGGELVVERENGSRESLISAEVSLKLESL